jgi:hypothetical protein
MANILKKAISIKSAALVIGLAILAYVVLIVGNIFYISVSEYSKAEANTQAQQMAVSEVDPALVPLVRQLRIDPTGLIIRYIDGYATKEQQGEFDGIRTITIARNHSEIEPVANTLAHEYLHSVWIKMPQQDKDYLTVQLNDLYTGDEFMRNRMKIYLEEGLQPGTIEFANELHSIYCSDISDPYLSKPVLDECNRWINRSALTFLR